jgi:hypothetical protein
MNCRSINWPRVAAPSVRGATANPVAAPRRIDAMSPFQRFLRGIAVAAALIAVVPCYGAMNLRFDGKDVVVTGVTHGATTLWMSLAHEAGPRYPRIVDRSEFVVDDDGDGIVRLTLDQTVRRNSIWTVVDMVSGDYVIDTPAPDRVRRHPLPPAAIHRKANGTAAELESVGVTVIAWCVRPGTGAWQAIVDDGAVTDLDGAMDGKVLTALSSMSGIESADAAPDDFKPGDVVIAVDLLSLDTVHGRVALSQ